MVKKDKKTASDDLKKEFAEPHESAGEPAAPELETQKEVDVTVKEDITTLAPAAAADKKKFDLKAFLKTKKGKITATILAVLLVVVVVFTVPASRYAVAGLIIKKDVHIELVDSETGKPVSAADIKLGNEALKTDADGQALFKNVPVGTQKISAQKSYYENSEAEITVPILRDADTAKLAIVATGRQVPVSVVNKISGSALAGVEIFAGDSTATTADNGEATLVLPADKPTVTATFKLKDHIDLTAEIIVTEQPDDKNKFQLTPANKVYFLSKRTGKINVMSSNLDGSDQKVVVEGTGKESQTTTVLLASRDWKYLALHAKRDDKEKLYLINTADGKLSVMDEGNADFRLYGWQNDHFVYTVTAKDKQQWEPSNQSLKTFNAANGKLTRLDTTAAGGNNTYNWEQETISSVFILDDRILYTKYWNNAYNPYVAFGAGKKDGIYSIKAGGENKQTLYDFDASKSSYMEARLYAPQEIYVRVSGADGTKFYEYENGKVTATSEIKDDTFYSNTYITYLISPSGKKALWHEDRDGKFALFVGDADGKNGKEIMSSEYKAYGWITDEYLLVSKGGSELFVMSVNADANTKPLKITDYHKPAYSIEGYGYGYGGL